MRELILQGLRVKSIVSSLCFASVLITSGLAMLVKEEMPVSEINQTQNRKKRKQPEPICLPENVSSIFASGIPLQLPILQGSFYFQHEKSTCTNSSTCVLEYQLFERNQDGRAYTSKNLITLTFKSLNAPCINITVNSQSQDREVLHSLENHTWKATAVRRDNTFFEIITKELNKEFYILRCVSLIEPDKPLTCWNPKGCVLQNSFHLNNNKLTLQPSLVLLKCGHYFHQQCLPLYFRKHVDGCPACGTLIENNDDFFTCDTTLPKITITEL